MDRLELKRMDIFFLYLFLVQNWRLTEEFLVSEPPRCQSCRIDHARNTICTNDDIIVCPSHETYCMNTFLKFGSRQTIDKRCATSKECEHYSSLTAIRSGTCNGKSGFINADHGQCHYCCKANVGALPCNFNDIPAGILTTAGHHHTTFHHTQKLSSSIRTETTHQTPTKSLLENQNTQSGGNICQKCTSGKGKSCSPNDVTVCPSDQPYCLNTFFTFGPKEFLLNKRCANVMDCHFFALDLMANKHNCSISPGFPSEQFKQCHYCCKTQAGATNPCNLNDIPISYSGNTSSEITTSTAPMTKTTNIMKATSTTSTATTQTTRTPTSTTAITTTRATTLTPTTTKTTTKTIFCSDNITECLDDPRADCANLDRLYGLCNNKGDNNRILVHCPKYCGLCDESSTPTTSTTTTPTLITTVMSVKHRCTDGTDIRCEDDPNVNCNLPATKSTLCHTSLASKYCPVSCGACHKLCPLVTKTSTTTRAALLPSTHTTTLTQATTSRSSGSSWVPITNSPCNAQAPCTDTLTHGCELALLHKAVCSNKDIAADCQRSCGLCSTACTTKGSDMGVILGPDGQH